MNKRTVGKKRRTARGKSRKSTTPRRLPNQDREAGPKAKKIAPAEAAPLVQDASPGEKERDEKAEQPFIIRAQVKLFYVLAGIVIDATLGWLWSRSVGHAHGVEGTAKIAAVTILPLIAVMYAIGMAQRGFMRAGAFSKTARTKVFSFSIAVLIILPEIWNRIGYEEICLHTFLGGAAGFAVAFFSWLYLAVKRNPWLTQRQRSEWEWVYRLSVAGMIVIGGWIGVIVS